MKSLRRLLALAFVMALVASACGGDDGAADAVAQQAIAAAEAEAAAAQSEAESARQEAAAATG